MRMSWARTIVIVLACVGACLATPARAADPVIHAPAQRVALEQAQPIFVEPPPPTGKGLFGAGIFGVSLGVLSIVAGATVLGIDPGHAGFSGAFPLGFGIGFVTMGALGIYYGQRRQRAHRAWAQRTGLDLKAWRAAYPGQGPPPGRGMIVGGSLLSVGSLALLGGSAGALDLDLYFGNSPRGWTYFGITAGSIGVFSGAVLLGLGGAKLHAHRKTRKQVSALVPVPWLGRRELGLGLVGRF